MERVLDKYDEEATLYEGDREIARVHCLLTEYQEVRDGIPRFTSVRGTIKSIDGRAIPDRNWALTVVFGNGRRFDILIKDIPSPLNSGPYAFE
ncbi:MAG: hypothetical protein LC793_17960 [Thermomicrobia bacterium]|nr:hypothetical protein [Thermomicrobia bacterium]